VHVLALQKRRKSQGRTCRSPAHASIALVLRTVFVAVHPPVGKWAWGGAIWQVPGLCGMAASTGVRVVLAVVLIPIEKLAPHPLAPPRRRTAHIAQ
jgi:hypothetical protein